jgi:hypothetical protein
MLLPARRAARRAAERRQAVDPDRGGDEMSHGHYLEFKDHDNPDYVAEFYLKSDGELKVVTSIGATKMTMNFDTVTTCQLRDWLTKSIQTVIEEARR